jgi:hypothetical protein
MSYLILYIISFFYSFIIIFLFLRSQNGNTNILSTNLFRQRELLLWVNVTIKPILWAELVEHKAGTNKRRDAHQLAILVLKREDVLFSHF